MSLTGKCMRLVIRLECGFSVTNSVPKFAQKQYSVWSSTDYGIGFDSQGQSHFPFQFEMVGQLYLEWCVIILWAFRHIKYSFLPLSYIRNNRCEIFACHQSIAGELKVTSRSQAKFAQTPIEQIGISLWKENPELECISILKSIKCLYISS